jgi:hypothetical protein
VTHVTNKVVSYLLEHTYGSLVAESPLKLKLFKFGSAGTPVA